MTGSTRDLLFTPEEVADRLGLHVRTVRRYIREGRLEAVKVGNRYRVTREALEAFAGVSLDEDAVRKGPLADVSSVVNIDELSREDADRLTTLLLASVQGRPSRESPLKVETVYYRDRRRLKLICNGDLGTVTSALALINTLLDNFP